jgi:hypothetical protein
VRRETVKARSQPRATITWWLATAVSGVVALGIAVWYFSPGKSPVGDGNQAQPGIALETGRFSAARPVTETELKTLQWEEVNQLLQAVGADAGEIERLARLTEAVHTPESTYLQALLLLLQQQPDQALAAFDALDIQSVPPAFLYAPYRLQQTLRPKDPNPYLTALRESVSENKLPPLVEARVRALDGNLREALRSYLRTDPASWAHYDLESLQRIGTHQGLAPDLRRLIAGALASGRVEQALLEPLQTLARRGAVPPDAEELKAQLRREIETQTPAGKIAVESAKKLIDDRNLFVERKYAELIDAHREAEPIELPTETVLLLFLSSVELKERVEMDRWGQELKRRHGETEVRDWVNQMTGTAR